MERKHWEVSFQAAVLEAKMSGRSEPLIVLLDFIPTAEEVCSAFRLAREADKRVATLIHQRKAAEASAPSYFEVRYGTIDADPPAFLEQFPAPLLA